MTILEALSVCKNQRKKIARQKWIAGGDYASLESNYSLPSYIFYSIKEDNFVAGFLVPDASDINFDREIVIDEDFRVGAIVSLWSTEDILADDWIVIGDASEGAEGAA